MTYRLYLAGRVETLTKSPDADAVLTWQDRVLAVGGRDELRRRAPDAEPVDFGDAVIVPGFNDAHQHPSLVAADLLHLDLSADAAPDVATIKAAIAAAAEHRPAGAWIRGSRYDEARLAGAALTRHDLDEAAPDHPVVVAHMSAHWGILNSRALGLAGLTESSEAPPGGVIGRDASERLTGVLAEQAYFDFAYPFLGGSRTILSAPPIDDWLVGWRTLQRRLLAAGITSVTDALAGPDELRFFQEARRRGELALRVNLLVTYPWLPLLDQLGIRSGFGDDRLRVEAIKVILDGSVSGQTCLVDAPIETTRTNGIQVMPTHELRRVIEQARHAGWRLAVHANGDRAIALLLDELDVADRRWGAPPVADRIEHGSIVTAELVDRIARRGLAVAPFGAYVHYHGRKLARAYGAARLEHMFAHRSLLDAGVTVAGASDYPCGPFEPLLAMQSCVTRRSSDGEPLGPGQAITAPEALSVYTIGSARASGQGDRKGVLAPGYLADLTVLADDPLRVAPANLSRIPVLATIIGGVPA